MREIKEIIVHCSATVEGQAFTVKDIDRWHRARKFRCIGYHYVIYLDGTIHRGRPETESGAHCTGHNAHSIGVCYIGGLAKRLRKPKDTRTTEQKASLLQLLRELKRRYPRAKIVSHRDYANKACPCFDATTEYKGL